jgi:hypothetical protein
MAIDWLSTHRLSSSARIFFFFYLEEKTKTFLGGLFSPLSLLMLFGESNRSKFQQVFLFFWLYDGDE